LIKPRRLKWPEIWDFAEEFRRQYVHPEEKVPVPIIDIVEIDLSIEPIPIVGLKEKNDIDGFLSHNLKAIYIDETVYSDERQENRLRFTYAHEVGHIVLHKDDILNCKFNSPEEWIQLREELPEDNLKWFELQAYEFAGRLLVPKARLIAELKGQIDKINQFREMFGDNQEEILKEYISSALNSVFQVSEQVISHRIRSEKVWRELNL